MKEIKQIKQQLEQLIELVKVSYLSQKDSLTFEEAQLYTGRSESNLYKLTSARAIPFYKPQGKMITFKRTELDTWMQQNPVRTARSIESEATTYTFFNKRL